jgi:hypothetical protein
MDIAAANLDRPATTQAPPGDPNGTTALEQATNAIHQRAAAPALDAATRNQRATAPALDATARHQADRPMDAVPTKASRPGTGQ